MRIQRSAVAVAWLFAAMAYSQDSNLHVVVRFDDHRLFTPAMRQAFREQVGQSLNSAMQGVGQARVFDFEAERPEDRLPDWQRSFQLGLDKLQRVPHRDNAKTHYILVEYRDNAYRITSRQADGRIGWFSPSLRVDSTADRGSLARIAVHHLLADSGLTGTIGQFDGDHRATIRFSGTNLSDARLREWVRTGDSFALIRVVSPGRGDPVPHAYFIATGAAEGGQITGKIESRFIKPLAGWESGQYRAVKIGAKTDILRLKIVGPNETTPADVSVHLYATGLGANDAERERGQSRMGRFNSAERYDRMAYEKFSLGDRVLAKMPIAVMGPEPITIEINTEPGGESAVLASADTRMIKAQVNDLLIRVGEDHEQLRGLISARKNQQAFAKVNDLLRQLEVEVPLIADGAVLLRSRSSAANASLDEIDRMVRELRQHEQTLAKTKVDLERAIAASGTPDAVQKRESLKALVARADRETKDADYDKAIATLEDVLKQAGDWPEIRTRLDEWKRGWAVTSDAHRDARKFVYDEWAKCTNVADVEKHIERAKQAFVVCKSADDKMTSRKVYLVLVKAASWIELRDKELRQTNNPDAESLGEALRKLSTQVKSLLDEVDSFIK